MSGRRRVGRAGRRAGVAPGGPVVTPVRRLTWKDAVSDTLVVAQRNIRALFRNPMLLVFMTVQPVLFVIMFRYVFGGAIGGSVPGGVPYVDFLMPGIFAQTTAFGAVSTGVGIATDLHEGFIDRFRALPMARSAVLAGRTLADLARSLIVILLMTAVGFLVGFRIHTNALAFLAAIGLLLLFAFSLSWVFAMIGLRSSNAEAAQAATFPILMPFTFASSAFVPTETMPGWLQVFANHQPVTAVVNAVRALCIGGPTLRPVLTTIAWSIGIVAVFAPLAVRAYRKVT